MSAALFKGLVDLLYTLSLEQPLLLALDDLSAVDDQTLEVMRRSLPLPGRVLFVGTARPLTKEDPEDSAYARFRRELEDLPNGRVIGLQGLDVEQTVELASNLLEGFRPPSDFGEWLWEHTQGNPLFVEGILRHLVETDALRREVGGWKLVASLPSDLPLSLDGLLRNQLKILSPELARVLAQAAVVGPNFEFNVLQASLESQHDEEQTLALVTDAVEAKLLREPGSAPDAELGFRTQALQEAAYQEIPTEERQEAHRRVAEALPVERAAERAFHFGRAGDRKKQDRFLRLVRERQELIFDREAVENLLLGSHEDQPAEVTDEPPRELFAALPILARDLATAAKVLRLYPAESNVVRQALDALVETLQKVHQLAPRFTLSHRGNTFVLNGHTVDKAHGTGPHQEAVIGIFRVNSIKSLTFVAPPRADELRTFLAETARHTVQVTLERYFWAVFSKQHNLCSLGIAQKLPTLDQRNETSLWKRVKPKARLAQSNPELVRQFIGQLAAAVCDLRSAPPEIELHGEIVASLHRLLRRLFEKVPAVAIHQGEGEALVVNGTALGREELGASGMDLLAILREGRLRGLVILKEVTPTELGRFIERIARCKPGEAEGISQDASLPNLLVGDGLYQLVHDLVRRRTATDTGDSDESEESLDELLDELLPIPERDEDLPPGFEWPSDAVAKRARTLYQLKPTELLGSQGASEFLELMEALLLDDRREIARALIQRMAVNFASENPEERKRAAELFLQAATRGTQELRVRFFSVATRRLCDALELESDFEAFEKLAECAKVGILDRIAEGDWDQAARLVWSLGRRREARAETRARQQKVTQRVLSEVLGDPRCARIFETLETGSQQERRRAARILEGMGRAAVDALVRALKRTQRTRVETFLIDMLAALAPDSDLALQKEVTPASDPEVTPRLLRAAAVVCQDPTSVLVSGLQNDDARVQSEAISVARSIGHNVAQNVLRWALAHGQASVQLEAVKHLGELSRPDTVDSLLELLQSTNLVEVQRECCLALGKLSLNRSHHEKVVPVLTNFLRTGGLLRSEYHQDVRAAAAWALGQMKTSESARKALERALDDKDKRVRLTARLTLEGRTV
ncbi:MAG: hypothetical protein D6731_04575 [Planctomycetota bacterium]|nr:MAG: hypothetical protein D6731_04575 [Planctomycetota bacterium]